jgi:hypothetical protein
MCLPTLVLVETSDEGLPRTLTSSLITIWEAGSGESEQPPEVTDRAWHPGGFQSVCSDLRQRHSRWREPDPAPFCVSQAPSSVSVKNDIGILMRLALNL